MSTDTPVPRGPAMDRVERLMYQEIRAEPGLHPREYVERVPVAYATAMAAARRLPEGDRYVRDGKWKTWGPLLLLGPEVIFGLTIAIFLGIFIGTYSSIYISSPILVWLGVKPDSFLRSSDERDAPDPQAA